MVLYFYVGQRCVQCCICQYLLPRMFTACELIKAYSCVTSVGAGVGFDCCWSWVASSTPCHRSWPCPHCLGYGCKRHRRSPAACPFSCAQSLVVWVLV